MLPEYDFEAAIPTAHSHTSFLFISQDNLLRNLHVLRQHISVPIMAVIKNNGYGLGLSAYTALLYGQGIRDFGLIDCRDALILAARYPLATFYLLAPAADPDLLCAMIRCGNIVLHVGNERDLELLRIAQRRTGKQARVQLKLDTGFGRYGFLPNQLQNVLQAAQLFTLDGIYTHFSEPYADASFTKKQFSLFMQLLSNLQSRGIRPRLRHCCASGAALNYSQMHLDMVRIGAAIIGSVPNREDYGLQQVCRYYAKLISCKRLPDGWRIGYGRHTTLHHSTQVGILQAGAMAGCFITRQESGVNPLRYFYRGFRACFHPKKLYAEIAGQSVPILGTIGMNHLAIDLSRCTAKIGDFALLPINPAFCPASLPRLFGSELLQEELSCKN